MLLNVLQVTRAFKQLFDFTIGSKPLYWLLLFAVTGKALQRPLLVRPKEIPETPLPRAQINGTSGTPVACGTRTHNSHGEQRYRECTRMKESAQKDKESSLVNS